MSSPGFARSTITHAAASRFASSSNSAADRAVRTAKPRSRAVPVTRLVKSRSSDNSRPVARAGADGLDMTLPPADSDRLGAALAGADAAAVLQRQDEDLAVA